MDDRTRANRETWDRWTEVNYASDFYDVDGFLRGAAEGRQRLDALDSRLLGDVDGLTLLHLQCHFGLDTLTQARRGANVVGVDFSSEAIVKARELAALAALGDRSEFVEADVLELDLERRFECVFTSWGVLGWIADLRVWSEVVARHLAPGGRFVLTEAHPFALLFDDESSHPVEQTASATSQSPESMYVLRYPYRTEEPLELCSDRVYSDPSAEVASRTFEWQHPLSDVVRALLDAGLVLQTLEEHDFCAWPMFPWLVRTDDGVWRQPADHPSIPLAFSLQMRGP